MAHLNLFLDPHFKYLQPLFTLFSEIDVKTQHRAFLIKLQPLLIEINHNLFPGYNVNISTENKIIVLYRE